MARSRGLLKKIKSNEFYSINVDWIFKVHNQYTRKKSRKQKRLPEPLGWFSVRKNDNRAVLRLQYLRSLHSQSCATPFEDLIENRKVPRHELVEDHRITIVVRISIKELFLWRSPVQSLPFSDETKQRGLQVIRRPPQVQLLLLESPWLEEVVLQPPSQNLRIHVEPGIRHIGPGKQLLREKSRFHVRFEGQNFRSIHQAKSRKILDQVPHRPPGDDPFGDLRRTILLGIPLALPFSEEQRICVLLCEISSYLFQVSHTLIVPVLALKDRKKLTFSLLKKGSDSQKEVMTFAQLVQEVWIP